MTDREATGGGAKGGWASGAPGTGLASLEGEVRLDAIMAVMEIAFDARFREAWNRRQVGDALEHGRARAMVLDGAAGAARRPADAAAFALTRGAVDEEELLLIAVAPTMRGQGLGRRLLAAVLADAKARGIARMFLEMREGNPAERLYRSSGFTPVGRRRDYYCTTDGLRIDALTFARSIG